MDLKALLIGADEYTGRRLGKYEYICRLSGGGMSQIFLAFQHGLGGFRKLVVLKQILPDIGGEEEFVRMFLDEARITATLSHPNIAQVFDLDVQEGELFITMEFVAGATLVEVAKACSTAKEKIPTGFTLAVIRDTANALHYAHTLVDPAGRMPKVVHRDVAQKNIMVNYDGQTKLVDFGIAKQLDARARTAVGKVKGTTGYMSPEQLLGQPLDGRSDVFSLGVVFHECLTGLKLFYGKTDMDEIKATLYKKIDPPSALNPGVPPEIDALVMRALSRKREERYDTANELAREIERRGGTLIWRAHETAEFMQRLFAERREQTRAFLQVIAESDPSGVNVSPLSLMKRGEPSPLDLARGAKQSGKAPEPTSPPVPVPPPIEAQNPTPVLASDERGDTIRLPLGGGGPDAPTLPVISALEKNRYFRELDHTTAPVSAAGSPKSVFDVAARERPPEPPSAGSADVTENRAPEFSKENVTEPPRDRATDRSAEAVVATPHEAPGNTDRLGAFLFGDITSKKHHPLAPGMLPDPAEFLEHTQPVSGPRPLPVPGTRLVWNMRRVKTHARRLGPWLVVPVVLGTLVGLLAALAASKKPKPPPPAPTATSAAESPLPAQPLAVGELPVSLPPAEASAPDASVELASGTGPVPAAGAAPADGVTDEEVEVSADLRPGDGDREAAANPGPRAGSVRSAATNRGKHRQGGDRRR